MEEKNTQFMLTSCQKKKKLTKYIEHFFFFCSLFTIKFSGEWHDSPL